MQDSFNLTETDISLINVLQVAPRATWLEVGRVLDINPVTAARRWQRLSEDGLAWVTAYPKLSVWAEGNCLAFIEVDCEPSTRHRAVEALMHVPQVASISQVGSGRDLFLIALFPDLQSLSRFMLDYVSQLTGVRGTRTHTATRFYSEASRWRLHALTSAQQTHLARHAPSTVVDAGPLPDSCHDLVLRLGADGRRTAAELAKLTSMSVSTARRRLERLIRGGLVTCRCEVAEVISGWPVIAHFWARIPPQDLETTARALVTLPEIRMCAAMTGTDNLIFIVWLHSLGDSQRLEESLAKRFPTLELTERAVVLRMTKRMGWLLDDLGRATSVVPIDPWAGMPQDLLA
ncbi:Lrp/AsnC family transcriptional regulator [Streptomyces sp. 891-h]|uniref:Lrp/AsnC family transcriptional regulator n=1 Tax=unclassified Streptomyces TaxID=2593676 RepID=UPI001FAAAB57|nr:Lrp/AsnC family transcriptional regulator [Streptomyces sp. 891-h]UNZ15837.1 Lrp/AsnC family transcriptional regulator [Streptomyces sp. 891-h]